MRFFLRMFRQPLSSFLRDVVDLSTTRASTEHVSHTNDDHLLIEQCIERLIQTRADHAHGLGKTRERDCPWNIPSLSKRFGKGPEEAQQLFLRAAQHGKVVQRW